MVFPESSNKVCVCKACVCFKYMSQRVLNRISGFIILFILMKNVSHIAYHTHHTIFSSNLWFLLETLLHI